MAKRKQEENYRKILVLKMTYSSFNPLPPDMALKNI